MLGGNDDGEVIAGFGFEKGDRGGEDFVGFAFVGDDFVMAVVISQSADGGGAVNWANVFVNEATVLGDGELQKVARDEFGFGGVVVRDGISATIGAEHFFAIKDTFDDFLGVSFGNLEVCVFGGGFDCIRTSRNGVA